MNFHSTTAPRIRIATIVSIEFAMTGVILRGEST